jgi:histidinol dehydrogenase
MSDMQISKYPAEADWKKLLERPALDHSSLLATVTKILDDVKLHGDDALERYTKEFDNIDLRDFSIDKTEIESAENLISAELKNAIDQAKKNISTFHAAQVSNEAVIETMPGVKCWRKNVAIEKVGLYVPGGSAPLFSSVLMLGIPAKLAGCAEIILCMPPGPDGKLHPAVLYAAKIIGIEKIYRIGGAQAIAAMAYGTESIPKVFKIFGPGNQFVVIAKQIVQAQGIGIDLPAGPSEVAVYADESADPSWVAADLVSQAEHGGDSQVLFITTSEKMVNDVLRELEKQIDILPRKTMGKKSLASSHAIIVKSEKEAMRLLNEYAPEHLILACANASALAGEVINAGSVFIGHYSPEAVGDYASGTNHTLPTNGYAKIYGGVSLDSFVKKITFQELSREGLGNIASTVESMAKAEGLDGHARAVSIRMESINNKHFSEE